MKLLVPGESMRQRAAPPVSIGCLACNGQYFAASLPIHQKTCFQRNAFVLVACEKCKLGVRACDFHSHTASCTGKPVDNNTFGFHNRQRSNLAQRAPMELNLPESDGRVRCKICERAFSQDRIPKHQSVCHGKPRSSKENHEPRRRPLIPLHQQAQDASVKRLAGRPRRKTVRVQRSLASQPRQVSFDFVSDRTSRVEFQQSRDTSRLQSCSYPGARTMQSGGCDTSNASSASNPLATNALMTMRR
ncbi:hypothetical protein PHYPSEUDO_000813 [Phytophthora pseudosyringae]|uniref:C2HC/C3H-type domain-containing protein n=1 Tax=Phytophthora pseudosyringae TaxID=221518 RepID=A0A8T1WGS1_9STRA|nr:hypothetical protein PHYPSEUDO_000813 [Phytophthora pseudosyringae]